MAKIGFKYLDDSGKWVYNYIEANSNDEALEKLERYNLNSFEFINDAQFGSIRDDLSDLSQIELVNRIKFEDEMAMEPSELKSFIEMLKNNRYIFAFALFVSVVGLYLSVNSIFVIGVLIFLFPIAFYFYASKNLKLFDEISRAIAFGDTHDALDLIEQMQDNVKNNQGVQAQLDKYKTLICACQGKNREVIELLKLHKEYYKEKLPGMYCELKGSVFYTIGKYDLTIKEFENMYRANPMSNVALDVALIHLRLNGNIEYAKELLKSKVKEMTIPTYGLGLYYLTQALLAQKEQNHTLAHENYNTMMNNFNKYKKNPHLWVAIALGVGYYADFLYDINKRDEGASLLDGAVVKILDTHTDDILREKLHRKYPQFIAQKSRCYRG